MHPHGVSNPQRIPHTRVASQHVSPKRGRYPPQPPQHYTSHPSQHTRGNPSYDIPRDALQYAQGVDHVDSTTSPPWVTPAAPDDTAREVLQKLHHHYEAAGGGGGAVTSPPLHIPPPPYGVSPLPPTPLSTLSSFAYKGEEREREKEKERTRRTPKSASRDSTIAVRAQRAAETRLAAAEAELHDLLRTGQVSVNNGRQNGAGESLAAAKAALRELRDTNTERKKSPKKRTHSKRRQKSIDEPNFPPPGLGGGGGGGGGGGVTQRTEIPSRRQSTSTLGLSPPGSCRQSAMSVTFLDHKFDDNDIASDAGSITVRINADEGPIGVNWVKTNGILTAQSVREHSPAARGGVSAGWQLLSINDTAVHREEDVDNALSHCTGIADFGMLPSTTTTTTTTPPTVSIGIQARPNEAGRLSRGVNTDHRERESAQCETLLTQVEVLQAAVEESMREREAMSEEIQGLERVVVEGEAAGVRCAELEALLAETNEMVEGSSRMVELSRAKHSNAEAQIADLEDANAVLQTQCAQLEATAAQMSHEVAALKEDMANTEDEHHNALAQEEVRMKEAVLSIAAELDEVWKTKNSKKKKKSKKMQEKQARRGESAMLESADQSLHGAQKEIEALQEALAAQGAAAADELSAVQEDLRSATLANETLAARLQEKAADSTHAEEACSTAERRVRILQQELDTARDVASTKANEADVCSKYTNSCKISFVGTGGSMLGLPSSFLRSGSGTFRLTAHPLLELGRGWEQQWG